MQIESIRFKNLNSLLGEWSIDFTNPEYVSNGIFAITGQTGAGKSTILDSITLALFGKTPRLGLITASSNEVMSRQTTDCFAEIHFKTDEGRFRSMWSQRRSRGKADGKLQAIQHEFTKLSDSVSENKDEGKPYPGNLDKIRTLINEKTGMNYDQFLRSMILAQGDFDLFLSAKPEERSDILERVTGTEIYSVISAAVFERYKTEKSKLDILQAELAGIKLLDDEEERELREKYVCKSAHYESDEKEMLRLKEEIDLLEIIASLKNDITTLREKERILAQTESDFQPFAERLERYEKNRPLASDYALLVRLRNFEKENRVLLASKINDLEKYKETLQSNKESFDVASKLLEEKRNEADLLAPVLKETRQIDAELKQTIKSIAASNKNVTLLEIEQKSVKNEIETIRRLLDELNSELSGLDEYFRQNAADNELVAKFSGLRERMSVLKEKKDELAKKTSKVLTLVKRFEKIKSPEKFDRSAFDADIHNLVSPEFVSDFDYDSYIARLNYELQSSERRRELLDEELRMILEIQGLDEYRLHLKDGDKCPLCGSEEHPYTKGNVPQSSENEIAREKEKAFHKMLSNEKSRAENARKLDTEIVESQAEIQSLENQMRQIEADIKTELLNYGVVDLDDPEPVLESLSKRRALWMRKQDDYAKMKHNITERQGLLKSQESLLAKVVSDHEKQIATLEVLEIEKLKHSEKRTVLFGEKDTDTEETRIKSEISAANIKFEQSRTSLVKSESKLTSLLAEKKVLEKSLESNSVELLKNESKFSTGLSENGFADENDYQAALIPQSEYSEYVQKAEQMRNERAELNAILSDKTKTLAQKLEIPCSEESLDTLREKYASFESNRKTIMQELGEIKAKLDMNDAQRKNSLDKTTKIEQQRKEYEKFAALNNLIGSKGGQTYRNFAQGLTLDALICSSNEQLAKLSNRYQLARKDESLEIDVIDLDQAGEIRSAKNLSGGESFLVSLSLALGLSEMMSRHINVETFFLDEGFGTLDEDTLNCALSVLSKLRASGKLIGIISHVGALKEQISTQLVLERISGGWSRIIGPGVTSKQAT